MKKIKIQNLALLLFFLIPYFLIFKAFFLGGVLSWGDAPFYYPENLKELFNQPFLWDIRNYNFGAPILQILWLYIPTSLMGALNHFLSLQSPILLRIIFFFPATIFSIVGCWLFLGLFTKNTYPKILGVFLYFFNTYFLLIIDGGQIGVALSYGLFPLIQYFLIKYLKKPSIKSFIPALFMLFVISNIDLRILILCFIFFIVFKLIEFKTSFLDLKKSVFFFGILFISLVSLDLFWIIPFVYGILNSNLSFQSFILDVNIITLLNSLLLFNPNFPLNEFGKSLPTPFYFALLPILILSGVLISRKKIFINLGLLFLLFAFLAKGSNPPFGEIYSWLTVNFPLGVAFRDSSKFFIPLFLSASLLLTLSVESLREKFKSKVFARLIFLVVYVYLLILIGPALLGSLNGSLNNQVDQKSYENLYHNLSTKPVFFRTLWFPERPPLGYSSWEKPGLSANELFKDRPFASMINGSYDLFGFLHSSELKQWFNMLGIRYVLFPENERQKTWTTKQLQDRVEFIRFISQIPIFKSISFGTNFPVYQIDGPLPQIFAQKKAFVVLGGEEIYHEMFKDQNFKLQNQGFVFLEQGIINPKDLFNFSKGSMQLLFVNKDKSELVFSFLKDRIISTFDTSLNQWAKKSSLEYLQWKNDLSVRGINTLDFDYGKGVSYSTIRGEKIKYSLAVPKKNKYILAIRYTNSSDSAGLNITTGSFSKNIFNKDFDRFHWIYFETSELEKGKALVEITNLGGTVALNGLVLLNKEDFNVALNMASVLINKYYIDDKNIEVEKNFYPVSYRQVNPTKYLINIPKEANWLTFTDHYNLEWSLNKVSPLPFYSMVNGFYLKSGELGDNEANELYFKPQKLVVISVLSSITSLFLITVTLLILKFFRRK